MTVPERKMRLAVVGAGQLGLYLSQSARDLGINTLVVSPDADAPALAVADNSFIADFDAPGLAARIAEEADFCSFELEDVPLELLQDLEEQGKKGNLTVNPAPAIMKLVKNKATQKAWLEKNAFPTLRFQTYESPVAQVENIVKEFGLPFVQKAQSGGYDGYGVQIIRAESELEKLWPVPSIIEQYLDAPTELAVVVARLPDGEIKAYPPVRATFDTQRNILDAVIVPSGFDADLDAQATELAVRLVEALDGVGVFAVEMFLDENEALLVNEISPRVHNSGHITMLTAAASQFEQHVRAICSLPLVDPGPPKAGAVMRNLLYTDELAFMLELAEGPVTYAEDKVALYWYGKREGRQGRKMGHVIVLTDNENEAGELTRRFIDKLRQQDEGESA